MAITSLRLQNFRSYRDASFKFGDGVNVVVGPNAAGKTNLLEAVLVLMRGRSYRARLPQLVRLGKPWARLEAGFGKETRILKITDANQFLVNNQNFKRLPARLGLPVVLFEPNHLQLTNGDPARRRDWLDGLVQNLNPTSRKVFSAYARALAQRNSLLKQPSSQVKNQIFAWDVRLSELAGTIVTTRAELIDKINHRLAKPYSHLAGRRQSAAIQYKSQFPASVYSSRFLKALSANLNEDIGRGFTGSGPHREDLIFYLNGQHLVETASRGEARSLLIALKLLEKDFLNQAYNQMPLMLLDDIFSELDATRRKALVDYLKDGQSLITTTDADHIKSTFGKNHQSIPIK